MSPISICCPIQTGAMKYAADILTSEGYRIPEVPDENTQHLLLPVPSFPKGYSYLESLLTQLPKDIRVYGGFLNVPPLIGYQRIDFLADPYYLARNGAITAECTIDIMENILGQDVAGRSVLILGWGRIGKCLGKLLQNKGAYVSIAARKDLDLAMIGALGYRAMDLNRLRLDSQFIVNTIPAMVLPQVPFNVYAIDLASKPGIGGENVIVARGLPSKMRPAQSGKLIAETFLRLREVDL